MRWENFNSHPHEEDDFQSWKNISIFRISTHILTKRMTGDEYSNYVPVIISTHILTKRMTVFWRCTWYTVSHFNSHPHEEDDTIQTVQSLSYRYFNSHPHEEDDLTLATTCLIGKQFQLTSSRRGWQITAIWKSTEKNFNSHPHEEDDWLIQVHGHCKIISTHILTKRMTYHNGVINWERVISTHILTKRMTMWKDTSMILISYFNSHPHEEDDWLSVILYLPR